MDLKDRFDLATSGGPQHCPLDERLAVGRRAQARRRTTWGAGVLAAIVAVGGTAWGVLPGDARSDRETRMATSTSPSPTLDVDGPTPPPPTVLYQYDLNSAVLETAPGVVINRQIESPVEQDGVVSSAAVVTYKDTTYWVTSAVLPGQAGWGNDTPAIEGRTFEQWVREQVVLRAHHMGDDSDWDYGWVTLGADGVLTPHKGATIIQQSSPARLDQAPAGVPSAQGIIEVNGARLCVLARDLPGDVVPVIYESEAQYQGCTDKLFGWGYPGDESGN